MRLKILFLLFLLPVFLFAQVDSLLIQVDSLKNLISDLDKVSESGQLSLVLTMVLAIMSSVATLLLKWKVKLPEWLTAWRLYIGIGVSLLLVLFIGKWDLTFADLWKTFASLGVVAFLFDGIKDRLYKLLGIKVDLEVQPGDELEVEGEKMIVKQVIDKTAVVVKK